jgi:hypothetical protein
VCQLINEKPTFSKAKAGRGENETQLSRVTVTKHLKEYYDSDVYKAMDNMYT